MSTDICPPVLKPVYPTYLVLAPVLVPLFRCNAKSGQPWGWIGGVGSKTGIAVVHVAKMPTQYILARDSMQVQCDGTMADVKMLPVFTSKRSPRCL